MNMGHGGHTIKSIRFPRKFDVYQYIVVLCSQLHQHFLYLHSARERKVCASVISAAALAAVAHSLSCFGREWAGGQAGRQAVLKVS